MRVAEITTADVLSVLQPIWLDKPETARRLKQRISLVLKTNFAKVSKQIKSLQISKQN